VNICQKHGGDYFVFEDTICPFCELIKEHNELLDKFYLLEAKEKNG